MKCERCQEREATIHLSQTRQGKTTGHHFCEICAQEQGISFDLHGYLGNLGSLFGASVSGGGTGGVFDTAGGIPAFGKSAGRNSTCQVCGQSFDEFRRTGLFGCAHCYESFADRLDPVFRRVQGSTRHVGRKVCQRADQPEQQLLQTRLGELKKTLQQAVHDEAYEKAARLRDEVRALESRLCVEGDGKS
jgi:protein arginine kinase activator